MPLAHDRHLLTRPNTIDTVIGNAASAWDAEYTHGRYRDEPPVDFVDGILATATGRRLRSGIYIGCGNGRNLLPHARRRP